MNWWIVNWRVLIILSSLLGYSMSEAVLQSCNASQQYIPCDLNAYSVILVTAGRSSHAVGPNNTLKVDTSLKISLREDK
jgi:hypothetical protein